MLAFEHPLAGRQLVKGTIEHGETAGAAAVRELAEEAGLTDARPVRDLGEWVAPFESQVWSFHLCEVPTELPSAWVHHAADGGGLNFRFFWQPLDETPRHDEWHELYRAALAWLHPALKRV